MQGKEARPYLTRRPLQLCKRAWSTQLYVGIAMYRACARRSERGCLIVLGLSRMACQRDREISPLALYILAEAPRCCCWSERATMYLVNQIDLLSRRNEATIGLQVVPDRCCAYIYTSRPRTRTSHIEYKVNLPN